MVTPTTHANAESTGACPSTPRSFPQPAKVGVSLRVLVVDAEPLVRWSVAQTLGARGFDVIEADGADAAIHALMDPPGAIDVVLLDLCRRDFRDLSLLDVMRRLAPTTPIILMTVCGSRELIERARDLGAFTVIDKPFDMNGLTPLVRRAAFSTQAMTGAL